mgnify:FL=1
MKVTRLSPISGKKNTMQLDITGQELIDWEKGRLIQDIFPHLTPEEREFIKTGITPDEWDKLFGDDV